MKRRVHTTTRRRLPFLAVATAALLLPLTACGGSDDSDDPIEGIGEGDNEEQQTESANPDQSGEGVERPEIVLPDGWENAYEDWESDEPTEQAVLDDARERQNAVDLAVLEWDPGADYLDFYNDADALAAAEDWVQGFIDNGRSIAGVVRYFSPEVVLNGESQATISFCADESDATAVDAQTGEDLGGDITEQFVAYRNTLQRDERGVWVTVSVIADREECE